jgi:uncharacterized membrane protein
MPSTLSDTVARTASRVRGLGLVALLIAVAGGLEAQEARTVRVGLSVGGVSTLGLLVEYVDGHGSTEFTIGTWSFRDLSASLIRRQYFGVSALRPVVGLGLWGILATPEGERPGMALVLRAPVGMDWRADGAHFLTMDINVNRGLWVRRTDPEDDTPLNQRIVPLPGISYRWWSR